MIADRRMTEHYVARNLDISKENVSTINNNLPEIMKVFTRRVLKFFKSDHEGLKHCM